MTEFQLQKKAPYGCWVRPGTWDIPEPSSDSVSALRNAIITYADKSSTSFHDDFRIVTQSGKGVERWRVRPGRAKKLRRRR